MRHLLRVAIGFFLLVFVAPAHVEAGLFSWLDRLSGPGPFWGIDVGIALRCPKRKEIANPKTLQDMRIMSADGIVFSCPSDRLDNRGFHYFLNTGVAVAFRNQLNYGSRPEPEPSTSVALVKVGSSFDYRLHPSLEVGAGAGLWYFAGPSFDNFARPYIQPVRVSIRPLLLNWKTNRTLNNDDYNEPLRRRGWLIIQVNLNMVLGTIDGATFGAPDDSWHHKQSAVVPEYSFAIDVVKLLKPSKH